MRVVLSCRSSGLRSASRQRGRYITLRPAVSRDMCEWCADERLGATAHAAIDAAGCSSSCS